MLEKEGYILLLQRATNIPNDSMFGGCIGNMPLVSYQFADPSVSDLLIEYVHKDIIVTEEFQRFCGQRFVSRDEQRFRRQIGITTSALVVAIAALLVNTFFNFLPKFTGGTKIKQEQIDTLANGLKSIEVKLESHNKISENLAPIVDTGLKKAAGPLKKGKK
jgi:hypothetical protein